MKQGESMDFKINFLSFYVIQVDGKDEQADKRYKHFQTLNTEEYEESSIKDFLDGEFKKLLNVRLNAIQKLNKFLQSLVTLSRNLGTH